MVCAYCPSLPTYICAGLTRFRLAGGPLLNMSIMPHMCAILIGSQRRTELLGEGHGRRFGRFGRPGRAGSACTV